MTSRKEHRNKLLLYVPQVYINGIINPENFHEKLRISYFEHSATSGVTENRN